MTASDTAELALAAARAADAKGGTDILVIDVGDILAICDVFLIVSGRNTRQVRAIADEIEEQLWLGSDRRPVASEGRDAHRWVLIDYGDLVVHVFLETEREFYRLERLYSDAPRIDFIPAGPPVSPN